MSFDTGEGAHVWATALEAWPEAIVALCQPFERIDLSAEDQLACLARAEGRHASLSDTLIEDLDAALSSFPQGAHLRLGLCSFKLGDAAPCFRTSADFAAVLSRPNPRVAAVLRSYAQAVREPGLFVFPWQPIPKWSEFRLFVRDGALIGASQYHTDAVFPVLQKNAPAIAASISEFAVRFAAVSHMATVVVDVMVTDAGQGTWDCTLLELNPFVRRTDPCMYTWAGDGDFDARLRFRKAERA